MQNVFNKYGGDSFKFEVIEECSRDVLIKTESYYIKSMSPDLNFIQNPVAIVHSNETLLKISATLKEAYACKRIKNSISKTVHQYNINGFYPSDVNRNQPAIIVPNLAINGQYFVFTSLEDHTLCTGCNNDYNKYNMYIVDFNNVLYPLGIVLNQQTQLLFTNVGYFGPLTLVKNATNDGYFVIIHTQPSQGNGGSFRSYRLNNSGFDINNPISSFISNDIGYQNYSGVGEFQRSSTAIMKFTPNGLKLGELVKTIFFHSGPNTSSSTSKFFTLDFNNSTGVFSNFTLIQDSTSSTTPMGTIYDFEFSSDGSKVYFLSDKDI
jgi:hypothetical protein